jgi:hypothetical protein
MSGPSGSRTPAVSRSGSSISANEETARQAKVLTQFKKGKCSQVRQASARCVATPMSEVFKTLAYFGGFASEGLSAAGN